MANLNRLILLFLFIPSSAFAITFGNGVGEVNLSGFTKLPDGTYARAFPNLNIELTAPPKDITVRSSALVPTSKGVFEMQISKTAVVDTARLGATVASFAKKVGPVGMGLTAASLVCELTTICDQAGQWLMDSSYDPALYPSQTNSVESYCTAGMCSGESDTRAPTASASCKKAVQEIKLWGPGYHYNLLSETGCQVLRDSDNSSLLVTTIEKRAGCPPLYIQAGSICTFTGSNQATTPTDSDWSSKQSLLNDDRFTPHLIDSAQDLPTVGLPSTPSGQTQKIHQQSIPVRDSSGNVIGRDDSETVIEAVDAATAEAPGKVVIKETTITNRYDNSNTLISTSETTNYTAQTEDTKPQSFEIKFDEVAPAELQTYSVPNTFDSTSWGGGSCPDDITVSVSGHTFAIPSQPVCDTAVMINPFVLLISTLIGVYIISGVRSGSAT